MSATLADEVRRQGKRDRDCCFVGAPILILVSLLARAVGLTPAAPVLFVLRNFRYGLHDRLRDGQDLDILGDVAREQVRAFLAVSGS